MYLTQNVTSRRNVGKFVHFFSHVPEETLTYVLMFCTHRRRNRGGLGAKTYPLPPPPPLFFFFKITHNHNPNPFCFGQSLTPCFQFVSDATDTTYLYKISNYKSHKVEGFLKIIVTETYYIFYQYCSKEQTSRPSTYKKRP